MSIRNDIFLQRVRVSAARRRGYLNTAYKLVGQPCGHFNAER